MKTKIASIIVLVVVSSAAYGQKIPINTNIAGFQHGQPPDVVGDVLANLGMTHKEYCGPRQNANEYVDCKFNDGNSRSIEVVFHHGWLHQVTYEFPINRYTPILNDLTKKFGPPSVLTDPHDSSYVISKDWGRAMDDNVSLIKRWDNKFATMEIFYNN
jgi:hypothetical protein